MSRIHTLVLRRSVLYDAPMMFRISRSAIVAYTVLALWALIATGAWMRYAIRARQAQASARSVPTPASNSAGAGVSKAYEHAFISASSSPAPQYTAFESAARTTNELIASLNERIMKLETELDEKMREINVLSAAATNEPPRRDRRGGFSRWLEDMKENEPERYEEFVRRREEERQTSRHALAEKAAHFLNRDLDDLTEEEREQYNYMMSLLTETWTLVDKAQNEELSRDERREIRHTLFENVRTLDPLLEQQRDIELYQIGLNLGYSDQDAAQFAEEIITVIDLTSVRSIWRAMRSRPPVPSPPE